MAVAFVLPEAAEGRGPAAWNVAALRSLEWKRASDRWIVLPYLTGPSKGGTRVRLEEAAMQFSANLNDIRSQFDESRERIYFGNLWSALARTQEPGFWPRKAARRLIVVNVSDSGPSENVLRVQDGPAEAGAAIQAISVAHNPALDALCQLTRGSYLAARTEEGAGTLVERACTHLAARYTVSYRSPIAKPDDLTVRIFGSGGWGETQLRLGA